MARQDATITIAEDDPKLAGTIEAELLRSLRATLPQSDNQGFLLSARSEDGNLAGGLTASTSYGWLLIKTVWVAEAQRGRGLGSALMDKAEMKARDLGCHGAWLDTSSPDAMRFYEWLGYETFGQLSNAPGQTPETHRRWFMKKAL